MHAAIICHDDAIYLSAVIDALGDVPATVFVNELPWGGAHAGDWQEAVRLAKLAGAGVENGKWGTEEEHRLAVLHWARQHCIQHLLIPDSDEIISPELLSALEKIAAINLSDAVYCTMDTYWKSPEYVIEPRERLMPPIMINPFTARYLRIREFAGDCPLMLSHEHGVLHHLSYSGPDHRIARKVSTWSHKDEVLHDWWKDVWERWDGERQLRDIHPTHPAAYGVAVRRLVPPILETSWHSYLSACGGVDPLHSGEIAPGKDWPNISVVIPLYGGPEDLALCLQSLEVCQDLLHEVLVVDDASPDDAPNVVAEFPFAKCLHNSTNKGFAATCNVGASATTGDVILFLNSDTVVPRCGLIRLIEALTKSGTVGAAGPMSNNVGHFQYLEARYSNSAEMQLLADDLARSDLDDFDCDMLVGFCLAIRRTAWDEAGGFDESFRVGMFEDNDLCHRLRRLRFRLVVSQRAFVHHKGNSSLNRHPEDKRQVFAENREQFSNKWKEDLEFGYASHLPGMAGGRVMYDETRRPDKVREEVAELAPAANISLCMIVRNEERVLGDCLASVKPFFSQVIVVDTGSEDRTVEIARESGAFVHEMEWPDSFAGARNESLKHATGHWICWLDADDTLPFGSGYAMLKAVTSAPDDLGGLVMPIRFVNDDPEFGTSVDHVKVFRNKRGWQFEGRIHEQILQDIRKDGLNIARLNAEVLHTGYDTSDEGQEKKRLRDEHLLMLDLQDRPGHPFVLFNLGMTAHYLQKHEEAIDWLKQSVAASQPSDSHVRKAYTMWAVSVAHLEGTVAGLAIVEEGLVASPDDPELLFRKGVFYTELEQYEAAAQAYERVLQAGRGMHFGSMDTGIFGYKTLHNLGGVYVRLGNYGRARESYLHAMKSNPRVVDSALALFSLAMENRDREASEASLNHLSSAKAFRMDILRQMEQDYRLLFSNGL